MKIKKIVKTYKDLNVYQLSYALSIRVFEITKKYPREETYALTDQLRRSSRSIPANICEGWAKRKYKNVFIRHLVDANGSCEETKFWLDVGQDCKYMSGNECKELVQGYREVGAMLNGMICNWKTF